MSRVQEIKNWAVRQKFQVQISLTKKVKGQDDLEIYAYILW